MAKYYVINVIKSEYFDVAPNEVYLLGVFDENTVRDKLKEYISRERWEPIALPFSGKTQVDLIQEYIDEILTNSKDFIYNNVGTTYSFIVETVELNELREDSKDNCILYYG